MLKLSFNISLYSYCFRSFSAGAINHPVQAVNKRVRIITWAQYRDSQCILRFIIGHNINLHQIRIFHNRAKEQIKDENKTVYYKFVI